MLTVGSRGAGDREVSKVKGLGEGFMAESQEQAFSWGTEPLLG